MQGLKKIEEIFARERKVVDDLLGIAKVFCISALYISTLILDMVYIKSIRMFSILL